MGTRRQRSKSGGFVPFPGAGEEWSTNKALSSSFIDHLHQIQASLALHSPGKALPALPKSSCYTQENRSSERPRFISSHTASVWVCAGEAIVVWPVGTMSTHHQRISKMCSRLSRSCWVLLLAAFLLTQRQNFFLESLICFWLLLMWKNSHGLAVMSEILVSAPVFPVLTHLFTSLH